MRRQKDTFIPVPKGDVDTFTPNGTTATKGFSVRDNMVDASYVSGGVTGGCGPYWGDGGWRDHRSVGLGYGSNADTTNATPRRPPDYGIFGGTSPAKKNR